MLLTCGTVEKCSGFFTWAKSCEKYFCMWA